MPRRFERDGQTRIAYSPADAVKLKAYGWREVTDPEPVTAKDLTVDTGSAGEGDDDGTTADH